MHKKTTTAVPEELVLGSMPLAYVYKRFFADLFGPDWWERFCASTPLEDRRKLWYARGVDEL